LAAHREFQQQSGIAIFTAANQMRADLLASFEFALGKFARCGSILG